VVLTPGDEIRNLLGRYTELMDLADWDAVGELFAHGTLATDDGTPLATGAEAVAAFYRGGTRLHDGSPRTKHLVADTVLEPSAPDRVVARSSFTVFQAAEGLPLQAIIAGGYVDTFADHPERGWHFVERRFRVDLTGDLSHHLTFDL
jgi:3-phenylpropionate/cinnamic acid dioxygenase small subunit